MKKIKQIFLSLLVLLFACSCFAFALPLAQAQAEGELQIAPLNPEFIDYIAKMKEMKAAGLTDSNSAAESKNYGYIPSPVTLKRTEQLSAKSLVSAMNDNLPSSYNNTVPVQYQTPVKDQGSSGACWAFSSLAAMESLLLKSGEQEYDFSERNMMNTHGFNKNYMECGNLEMAVAYLSRWGGPVSEDDDYPFLPPDNSTKGYMSNKIRKHLQDTLYIESGDLQTIKKAIREYGAVYSTFYFAPNEAHYYNPSTAAYYCYDYNSANHAITLVGWDDSYDKTNFSTQPMHNGAFLVKNSWGTGWGKNGYFYLSYEDVNLAEENYAVTKADPSDNYGKIYQYDPLGWVDNFGYSSNTAWFSNVFTCGSNNEALAAVSFYTTTPNVSYEVYVAPNIAGSPPNFSGASPIASGTQTYAGYHTVSFDVPVTLPASSKFAVAVKVRAIDGYGYNSKYPIATECYYPGYSNAASASKGQSFVSPDGSRWQDLTSINSTMNVCLKAFTDITSVVGENASITLDKNKWQINIGQTIQLFPTISPDTEQNKNIIWSSSNEAVARVYSPGIVTGVGIGNAIIYATSEASGQKTACALQVVSATQVCTPTVSNVSDNTLRLNWTRPPASGSIRYYIYYATGSKGPYRYLANTSQTYKDIRSLSNGKTYYFKVRAKVKGIFKEYSTATSGTKITVNTQVLNLKASKVTSRSLRLGWSKIPLSGVKYYIYCATSANGTYKNLTSTYGTYKDIRSLISGKTYYFKVRARIAGKYKAYSDVLEVNLP